MSGEGLADQRYWGGVHDGVELSIAHPRDPLRLWIERHVPPAGAGQTCLEVGCYPGRYLAVLGALGYELHGVDLSTDLEALDAWLRARGYPVGELSRSDFFELRPPRRFDVVLSLGFIEHFRDWPLVLERHAELVASGGLLVLESPNYGGALQGWFHRRFDRASYDTHFLPAMDPSAWAGVLRPLGFEVTYAGHFGRLALWVEPARRSLLERICIRAATSGSRVLKRLLPPDRPAYAPFCGLVARRRTTPDATAPGA